MIRVEWLCEGVGTPNGCPFKSTRLSLIVNDTICRFSFVSVDGGVRRLQALHCKHCEFDYPFVDDLSL